MISKQYKELNGYSHLIYLTASIYSQQSKCERYLLIKNEFAENQLWTNWKRHDIAVVRSLKLCGRMVSLSSHLVRGGFERLDYYHPWVQIRVLKSVIIARPWCHSFWVSFYWKIGCTMIKPRSSSSPPIYVLEVHFSRVPCNIDKPCDEVMQSHRMFNVASALAIKYGMWLYTFLGSIVSLIHRHSCFAVYVQHYISFTYLYNV